MKIINDPEKPKKRKVSKKTKKSWRKHVDTTDVDAFLENSRLEERLGGPFSERLDSDLFVVDKSKDEKIVEDLKKQRRLRLKNKEPKCFSVLKPHTAVPDPISKRNRVRTPEERKHPILKRKERERKLKGILKSKEKDALKNRALANKKRLSRPKRGEFNADIWAGSEESPLKMNTEWLSSDTIRHTLVPLGKKKKRLPTSLHKKPSIVSAVEAPHPGTSYNPSYKDHQDLLRTVAEKEKELMKQEAHLLRVTKNMFKKVSADEKHKNEMHEMSEGLPTAEEKSKHDNKDDNDDDPTVKSVNPPVKNAKKTLKQRRKQKEQKALALEKIQKKTEKKKVADIYKLKLLQKQLKAKESKETKLREKRLKLKELKSVEAKTLSKVKFEPSDPDFVLPSEISGNLRNSEAVGNLLKDRFKSLQQRNIVAPGTLVLKRSKAKVKTFIKPDHKINWEAEMKRIQNSNPKVHVK